MRNARIDRFRHSPRMANVTSHIPVRWFIREWRKSLGISQDVLAAACDTSKSLISEMESGKKRMNDDWIGKFANALKITPSDLLRHPNDVSPAPRVPLISWVSAGAFADVGTVMPTDEFPMVEIAGLPDGNWFALTVEGDSMNRISPPGSVIAVNRRDRRLVPNACYVIANEDGEVTYKRYRPSPERYEPVSTNDEHQPLFPNGSVKIIGRVRRSILEM